MEVTKHNFKESLDLVCQTIDSASFLAIDAEFTGLDTQGNSIHAFDTPEERYEKLIQSAKTFIIIQFGLSAFQYNEETKRYTASVFNFSIFPRPHSRQAPDVRFTCQSSSLEFLACQGMDFGKIVRDGISYLLPADEQRLLEALKHKHAQQAQAPDPELPPSATKPPVMTKEQKRTIDASLKRIDEFLKSNTTAQGQESINLDPCNGFLRKCLFDSINKRFKLAVHLESKVNEKKQRYIQVSMPRTKDDRKHMEQEKQQAELQELYDAVGFSKVIKKISLSKKLVVGHNMYLDILHVIDQFCCALPSSYEDFKNVTRCLFPRLIDTKHMASSQPFKDFVSNTTLADLEKELEKPPFAKVQVDLAEGFPSYENAARLHEAGYDSYITGLCFLSMTSYLGLHSNPHCHHVCPESNLLEPFRNKIHLMRIGDIPYVNLEGVDMPPSRDHVFHLTFDKETKAADILGLFSPFGNIQIVWLNDTSALAGLYKKEQAQQASSTLTTHWNGWCRVLTYSDYVANIKNAASHRPISKRKLTSSDAVLTPSRKSTSSISSPLIQNNTSAPPMEEEPNNMDIDEQADQRSIHLDVTVNAEEDLGEPVAKRQREEQLSEGMSQKVVFDEPDEW